LRSAARSRGWRRDEPHVSVDRRATVRLTEFRAEPRIPCDALGVDSAAAVSTDLGEDGEDLILGCEAKPWPSWRVTLPVRPLLASASTAGQRRMPVASASARRRRRPG
jgi:hypothetical protein